MRFCDCIDACGIPGVSGPVFVSGSFGVIDGDVEYVRTDREMTIAFEYTTDTVCLKTELSKRENGVIIRKDYFENLSNSPVDIYRFVSRFRMDGNEYDVYTQYNAWQHENCGAWQPLVTQVRTAATGVRTCDGAAPILAMHNKYTGKNTVFHLIPNAQWSMTAKKFAQNEKEIVLVETGFHDEGMHLTVKAGERIELPTVIFFTAESKTDLDAYKLHEVYNEMYPRRSLPVAYNSWLDIYDNLDFDLLLSRVDKCAEMGFEAFMIDAGWFGSPDQSWSRSVGDWVEPENGRLGGRLDDISRYVREKGMIFGLWFEPERAYKTSRAVAEHSEYYIPAGNDYLLDFSNHEAVDYIYSIISEQIRKYHIGWVKFDFNATIPTDPSGDAFYRYMQGQKDFVLRMRKEFPELYMTNCASGGYRMDLGQGMLFDSIWISDNQGPYEGIRILKDTLKRMPTSLIERWNVQKYCEGFPQYHGVTQYRGRMIHTNNGTWDFLIGIDDSFSEAFVQGGMMGFSCNMTEFSQEYQKRWTDVISQYKKDREFFISANARILVDSEQIVAIEYSDRKLERCFIQIYTKTVYANELVIYPVVDESQKYLYGDTVIDGRDIAENGILVEPLKENCCKIMNFIKLGGK